MIRLFQVFIPASILGLIISETLLVSCCYLLAMRWQFEDTLQLYLVYENGLPRLAIVTAVMLLGLYLNDCYVRVRMQSHFVFLQQLCLVTGVEFLIQAMLSYGNVDIRMPRQSMLIGSSLCLVLLPLWRTLYSKVLLEVLGAEKILFLGTHPLQLILAEHLSDHPEFTMRPMGFLVEDIASTTLAPELVLGEVSDALACAKKLHPDRIVVGLAGPFATHEMKQVIELQQSGYRLQTHSEAYEVIFGRVPISQGQYTQLVFRQDFVPSPLMLRIQALYSWLFAFIALLPLLPVILVVALAVRLSSPGPILFRQIRAGRNNRPFTLYKFRSMFIDAEATTGAVWAQENDPRVTAVGRVLRKYRFDELPQLFNVLKGEMAIVGPRPERPEFISTLVQQIPYYMQRLAMSPGITGWAQINYRYGNTVEDTVIKLEYDLYYIKHFSPRLDFYIMFHTIKTMLLTRGAY